MDDLTIFTAYYQSPVGSIQISASDQYITSILYKPDEGDSSIYLPAVIVECIKQLKEYFAKERTKFDLPFKQEGTAFQQIVWKELLSIPYGETISYRTLAKMTGNVHNAQAVGSANGKNKINIIVPCHRVIGTKGDLRGYGGGLYVKDYLLKHESNLIPFQ